MDVTVHVGASTGFAGPTVRAPTGRQAPRRPGGAVVLGASYRALAVVRSLGRAGIPVAVVRTDEHVVAQTSRYGRRLGTLAGGDTERRDRLLALAERHGLRGWVLIATADEDAAMVAREHQALSGRFVVTTPPWPVLRLAYDKREVSALASRLGLPQPWTAVPQLEGGIDALAPRFPAVLKPAMKIEQNALTAAKAWRVDDHAELARRWTEACRLVDPSIILLQELIEGGRQLAFAALCRDGEVLAELTASRARQYPIDFGRASTFVETIEDPSLGRDGRELLAAMRYTGIVEVEYVRDQSTGANLVLDVNPRAWGWQSLGARAGVDFPLLLFRMAAGAAVHGVRAAPGARWVRLLTDVPAAVAEWRRGRLTVRSWVRSLRGPVEGAIFAKDDPVPACVDAALLLRLAAVRVSRGQAV
jgi:D-aspartate ligase